MSKRVTHSTKNVDHVEKPQHPRLRPAMKPRGCWLGVGKTTGGVHRVCVHAPLQDGAQSKRDRDLGIQWEMKGLESVLEVGRNTYYVVYVYCPLRRPVSALISGH